MNGVCTFKVLKSVGTSVNNYGGGNRGRIPGSISQLLVVVVVGAVVVGVVIGAGLVVAVLI
jgi:hypothetical protein